MKSHPTKHIVCQRYDSTLCLVINKRGCYLILKGFKGFNVTKGSATLNYPPDLLSLQTHPHIPDETDDVSF